MNFKTISFVNAMAGVSLALFGCASQNPASGTAGRTTPTVTNAALAGPPPQNSVPPAAPSPASQANGSSQPVGEETIWRHGGPPAQPAANQATAPVYYVTPVVPGYESSAGRPLVIVAPSRSPQEYRPAPLPEAAAPAYQNQNRPLAGPVAGALIGGFVGSQFGGGTGKLTATAIGAATGAVIGNSNSDPCEPGPNEGTVAGTLFGALVGNSLGQGNTNTTAAGAAIGAVAGTRIAGKSNCR